MANVRWQFNAAGFAELRNHPSLVAAMESTAERAAEATPFEVETVTWPHQGRKAGPRTSVQIWARSPRARTIVNRDPATLIRALDQARL